ncbi:unnamed protein product [Thelazia callipaeda]|uniref:Peptidase A1 domain-containing protein n=1 Tax=Thelazia callipaeda TaxID=103827 RepID=A0A0N5DCH2_THECL|nr:unnamed protein product [Thelazia callipaeda]
MNQMNDEELKVKNAAFGTPSVLKWDDAVMYYRIDGVLGLSSLNISDTRRDNPIHKVLRSSSIDPIITIALPPRNSSVAATLTLGASNNYICAKSDKQVTEKLVSSRDRYDFAYSSISMGNKTFSLQWRSAFAYVDTIRPYIGVPDLFMQELILKYDAKKKRNTGADVYWVDCNQAFEPFYLRTANNTYVVEPSNFVIKHDKADANCELGFRSHSGPLGPVALGIPFLNQYCAILEPTKRSISFRPIVVPNTTVYCFTSENYSLE